MKWPWWGVGTVAAAMLGWTVWRTPEGIQKRVLGPLSTGGLNGQDATTACMSNLRGLAQATSMYSADSEGRFPPADRWTDAISSYCTAASADHCPSVSRFGYAFMRHLSGKPVSSIQMTRSTALLFDSITLSANANDDFTSLPSPPRHGTFDGKQGNLLAFVDGHADWVKR